MCRRNKSENKPKPELSIFKNNEVKHEQSESIDDEWEIIFDKETIRYIESLKDKFGFENEIDPHEFIHKIGQELVHGKLTQKQRHTLEELKRGLLEDLAQTPLPLENDEEIDYSDESEGDELTPAERQYLIYQQLQNSKLDKNTVNYKNDLRLALMEHLPKGYEVEDFEEDEEAHGYPQISPNKIHHNALIRGMKQAEIIDSMKPQYYFNTKSNQSLHQLYLNESEQDSKESTSKTPWFIGTPTSGSQIGSLNGTGAVKAEDLINAMKNTHSTKNAKYTQFSSNNSSFEKNIKPVGLHGAIPVMSFGGDDREKLFPKHNESPGMDEYRNNGHAVEFDTFRT